MCGIAGFSGSFDSELLERMNAVLAHRGPDDSGTCYLDRHGIGLAHRRLTIIDLSKRGRQPMWDVSGAALVSYNGEIYNYRELRRELESEGRRFRSESDTEVLLNLYLRDGPDMLAQLEGIYAFALWDQRQEKLFVARDGLGVKPLYYAVTGRGFLFASELKALLAEPSLDRELDPEAIHAYLTYLWCPAPKTILKGVRKLPPGRALLVAEGRIERQWQHYELPCGEHGEAVAIEEARREVHRLLARAVKRQMVADVPVGAFLSGGLDSSSVVAFARHHAAAGQLPSFCVGLDAADLRREGMIDDLPYAERVARHLGVDLHTVKISADHARELETVLYHLDEPQADLAPLGVLAIARQARREGVKVLLSGAGGDDIFTGYRRHLALRQERFWSWLPRPARRGLEGLAERLPGSPAWLRRLAKMWRYAARDGDARIASYFYWIDPRRLWDLYTPELATELESKLAADPLVASLAGLGEGVEPLERMLYLEGKHFLADHNLLYTDKMSMAAGIEVRVPLLDTDLVRYVAGLPGELKQRGSTGKWIFKRAMEGELPDDVIYRPKTGFGAPLRPWLKHELRDLVDEVLCESSLGRRGLFDPRSVARLVEDDRRGRLDASYTIFSLVSIEMWCRIFLDRRTAES